MANWVIIGSNRGIGLELAKQVKQRGDHVIAVCRKSSPELEALSVTTVTNVDITKDDDVARLASALSDATIDVLVVMAGVLKRTTLTEPQFDVVSDLFEVNAVGPLRVSVALRSQLQRGSKIALITSRMGSIDDNTSGSMYAYRMSKAALNMAGKSLSVDLASDGIAVALLHPGAVRTEMTGGHGLIEADESVAGLIARIDELNAETSGGFWHMNGERLPW